MNYVTSLAGEQLSPHDVLVLLLLANRYNSDQGIAWPSHSRLAAESHLTRRGLQGILDRLQQRGLIRRVVGNGRGHPTLYSFPAMESAREKEQEVNSAIKGEPGSPFNGNSQIKSEPPSPFNGGAGIKGEPPSPFSGERANATTQKGRTPRHIKGEPHDTIELNKNERRERNPFDSDLSRTEEAEASWKAISAELKAITDRQSWETWLSPLWGAGVDGKSLVVCVPNREFQSWVRENYSAEIQGAAERLGLAYGRVQFRVRAPRGGAEGGRGPFFKLPGLLRTVAQPRARVDVSKIGP